MTRAEEPSPASAPRPPIGVDEQSVDFASLLRLGRVELDVGETRRRHPTPTTNVAEVSMIASCCGRVRWANHGCSCACV